MAESPQQPQQPATRPATPEGRAAAILAALAAGAAVAGALVLTAAVLAALTRLFLKWGYRRETVRWALRVTTELVRTGGPPSSPGPAELANARAERVFTAWFIERSAARVEAAYEAGADAGAPEAREDRYVVQHVDAQEKRREAARRVDAEAGKPGQVTDRPADADGTPRVILKWRAHPDDKVTPECRAADGCWFYADTPPIIGYPGMPHGGTCRCWPANAGSLAEVARGRHVNEAVRGIIAGEPDHRTHPGAILPAAASA